MKTLLFCLFFLSGCLYAYPKHSHQLSHCINALYQLEDTRLLLESVEAQGTITIKAAQMGHYATNAAWYPDERTICVNFSHKRSYGSLIRSLVFELHNALNQKEFDHYDALASQKRISKEKYIESVEYLEYTNALKTAEIMQKGINQGIFPGDSGWCISSSFAEHYQIQKEAGHSKCIGDLYDVLAKK